MSIAAEIVALLPAHSHYVEPYCGSLSVLLAKPPAPKETVNDLDGELMLFWRVLRDRPEQLARVCALTPHSRAEHAAAGDPANDELEAARRIWVRLTQGRSGTLRKVGWRYYINPSGSSLGMPAYLAAYVDRLAPAAERLATVSLECRSALDVINAYGSHADALLYVDPPYPGSTRAGANYRHEMTGEAEHRELAEALHAARAAVVISGYPSDLYDRRLYAGWDRHTIAAHTSQGNTSSNRAGNRVEVLWSNRPLGNQPALFDTTQLCPTPDQPDEQEVAALMHERYS